MKNRTRLQAIMLYLVVGIGLVPLFYFVTTEINIARAASGSSVVASEAGGSSDRVIDNVAFGVHELLTFDVNYGFINAGTATMEVARLIEYNDRPCYQIITKAKSNSFFEPFYKVQDSVESIVDAIGLYSWRFEGQAEQRFGV